MEAEDVAEFFADIMRFLLALLLLCWTMWPSMAQTYFNERYQNPIAGNQTGFTAVVVRDSGYLVIGNAYNYPAQGFRSLTLRFLDWSGQQVRARYYTDFNVGNGNSLQRLPDGGYILVGQRSSPIFPFPGSTVLWRFNAIGDTLWTRSYLRGRGETAMSMCVLPDGGFAIVGSYQPGPGSSGATDLLLTRTDSLGQLLWWQAYDNEFQDRGWSVVPTPDGGFLLGGFSDDLTQVDSYVVKTSADGSRQWQHAYGSPTLSDGLAICAVNSDGNYLVAVSTGKGISNGETLKRPGLYVLSPQGQTLDFQEYGPARFATDPIALHVLADGSAVCAGQQSTALMQPEAFMFKVCADRDSIWYRTYKKMLGPDSHNYVRDIKPTPDGGFVASGFLWSLPPDTGSSDGWVFKVDSAGYLQAGGPPVTVQCRPTAVNEEAAADALQVWPNPSADGRFQVRLPVGATALQVVDALGRRVLRESTPATETMLDLSGWPAGLYLLRVVWPDGRVLMRQLLK